MRVTSLLVSGLGVWALISGCSTDGSGLSTGNAAGVGGGTNGTAGAGNTAQQSGGGTTGQGGLAGGGGSAGAAGNGGGAGGSAGAGGSERAGGSAGTGGRAGSGGGAPPIVIVQSSLTMVSMDAVSTLTLEAAPRAGNAIIVGVTCISSYLRDCVLGTNGVTDNRGNVYTRIVQGEALLSSAQGARAYIFIAENVAAPGGAVVISVDPDGTPDGAAVIQTVVWGAIEVSGLAARPSLDAWGISLAGGSGAMSTTAATDLPTVQRNELAVAVLTMRSSDTNMLITPEASWTSHHIHQNGAAGPPGHSMISNVRTSTGIVSHTWTHDPPTRSVAAVIATFKGATQN